MSSNKRVKVFKDDVGDWRWTLWLSSDAVSRSTEGYRNKGHAVEQAKSLFPDAQLEVEDCEEDA